MNVRQQHYRSDAGTVLVIGAGTIGSHLLRHMARSPEVRAITVVDRDRYEERNLVSQDISIADIGKFKAKVQKRLLRRVRPDLRVRAVVGDIENIPMGALAGHSLLLSAVDSRAARQTINRIAFRLGGVPWIDAGIERSGLLARVHAYRPADGSACLECSWSQADYAALEQVYPCDQGTTAQPAPAAPPSSLGGLAAALQAIEAVKVLQGRWDDVASGHQVLIDARQHKHYVTLFPRNGQCRFDHNIWRTEMLDCSPHQLTLGQAFEMGRGECGPDDQLSIGVEPHRFIQKLKCTECGAERDLLRLDIALNKDDVLCLQCGSPSAAPGFSRLTRLERSVVTKNALARTISELGFRQGDVYTVSSPRGERHFGIPCDSE